jgi:hypothetical protein
MERTAIGGELRGGAPVSRAVQLLSLAVAALRHRATVAGSRYGQLSANNA